jgi:hypothetical protein
MCVAMEEILQLKTMVVILFERQYEQILFAPVVSTWLHGSNTGISHLAALAKL